VTDEQKNKDPHATEEQFAEAQVGMVDQANRAVAMTGGFFGNIRVFGRSNFEKHDLNDMVDMVESANPEALETAGRALCDARDAIHEAAEELKKHVGRVDWEGESGSAFREWGGKLAGHALELADFAETAGAQMMAAATGLASVRSAIPPRDNRAERKSVADIPTPQQVDGNEEYTAAVKAEKNRQEAINQMNRLASFYAVSEETLAKQKEPTFEPMPDVGVPKPLPEAPWEGGRGTGDTGGSAAVGTSAAVVQGTVDAAAGQAAKGGSQPPMQKVDEAILLPAASVGTEIDSVAKVPPQDVAKPPSVAPPSTQGTSGISGGNTPLLPPGPVVPAAGRPVGRTPVSGGSAVGKSPVSSQGRSGIPTAAGRGAVPPVERHPVPGALGNRGGGTGSAPPIGRGVSGGLPHPVSGPAAGRAGGVGATGAARGNGIVGGRPAPTTSPGGTNPTVPRGTVVGAERTGNRQTPSAQVGQRGVIGASPGPAVARSEPLRSNARTSIGVVGTPAGQSPNAGNRSGPYTGVSSGQPDRSSRKPGDGQGRPEDRRRNMPPSSD
jgi:uncharacterized protein YukE